MREHAPRNDHPGPQQERGTCRSRHWKNGSPRWKDAWQDSKGNQKISRQFLWLVGIQIAALLAVVGALVGR